MELDRRQAILSVAMALVARPARAKPERSEAELPECHQLTRSLIERARRASTATNRVDFDAIERIIRRMARGLQGATRYKMDGGSSRCVRSSQKTQLVRARYGIGGALARQAIMSALPRCVRAIVSGPAAGLRDTSAR